MNAIHRYKPRHEPGCACVVCWCAAFHKQMHDRNEARAERCRRLLANPETALTPAQGNFFAQLDEVAQ